MPLNNLKYIEKRNLFIIKNKWKLNKILKQSQYAAN